MAEKGFGNLQHHLHLNLAENFHVSKLLMLLFEIVYNTNSSGTMATDIIAFQELEVLDLEPGIEKDDNGNDIKVWYQMAWHKVMCLNRK